MQQRVKTDSLGLLYENLANVDNLASYWATQTPCSPQYRKPSAPYIGPQVPRTSKLLLATQIIVSRVKLTVGLQTHYMPYLNEHGSIMQMIRSIRPPEDMPLMNAYFENILKGGE